VRRMPWSAIDLAQSAFPEITGTPHKHQDKLGADVPGEYFPIVVAGLVPAIYANPAPRHPRVQRPGAWMAGTPGMNVRMRRPGHGRASSMERPAVIGIVRHLPSPHGRPPATVPVPVPQAMDGRSTRWRTRIFGCSGAHNLCDTGAHPAGMLAHAASAPGHHKRIIILVMPRILWLMRPAVHNPSPRRRRRPEDRSFAC